MKNIRILAKVLSACVVAAGSTAVLATPASATLISDETFSHARVQPANTGEWRTFTKKSGLPTCMTAATKTTDTTGSLPVCQPVLDGTQQPDPDGQGALRLTDNNLNDAGFVGMTQAVNARQGLHIAFDMYQYNVRKRTDTPPGTDRGADGLGIALLDGGVAPGEPGMAGGFLGYKPLKGAFVGVAFDEYGNASNKTYWKESGGVDGRRPNAVVLRGSEATNYQYLKGVTLNQQTQSLAADTATTRDTARRTVNLDISTSGRLSVYVDFRDGRGLSSVIEDYDLDRIPSQSRLPDTIRLAFGAATGDSAVRHEINNIRISSLDPDLTMGLTAQNTPWKAGGTGSYQMVVANKATAGPTTGDLTTTLDLPDGITATSAGGTGWSCSIPGRKVVCTRPGILVPEQAAPPITVNVAIAGTAASSATATATVTTRDEHKPEDNTAGITTTIGKPAVHSALRITMNLRPNPYSPGGPLTYTITVTNDGPAAAPGARVAAAVSKIWGKVPWTCAATIGSSCPGATGMGDIDAAIDVAAGGTVTFTASCEIPDGVTWPLSGAATVTPAPGTTDSNCQTGCTATATARPPA